MLENFSPDSLVEKSTKNTTLAIMIAKVAFLKGSWQLNRSKLNKSLKICKSKATVVPKLKSKIFLACKFSQPKGLDCRFLNNVFMSFYDKYPQRTFYSKVENCTNFKK